MDLSVFLAKWFGIYFLIIAAIWLLRKREFEADVIMLTSNTSLVIFTGILQLLIGLAIAISHPIFEVSWRGLITLIGYFGLIQGVLRIAFPVEAKNAIGNLMRKSGIIVPIILMVLGVFLTYSGFTNANKIGIFGF